ncbi:MAG: hypothetical protein KDA92_22805, partial [Planctomycetales bacterium]|nr:hypothetical protein [Planctomycetales bacterium]
WHQQNWHSFLEQTYGFINGIAILAGMAVLVRRVPPLRDDGTSQDWTQDVALVLVLPVLLYVNLVKNLEEWVPTDPAVKGALPREMSAPWIDITLSASQWFHLFFLAASFVFVAILLHSRRRAIAVMPSTWVGRGQLLLLAILWTFVIGNFGRALPGFNAGRLLTEGIIFLNALAATAFLLVYGTPGGDVPAETQPEMQTPVAWRKWLFVTGAVFLVCSLGVPAAQTWTTRQLYGDAPTGKRNNNFRFGPHANWRLAPLLRGEAHR